MDPYKHETVTQVWTERKLNLNNNRILLLVKRHIFDE